MAGGVTAAQIYQALISAGASTTEAIGIMANMMNESSLNPEAQVIDSNGLPSSGLVQENGTQYTGLVTGNPVADMNAQIRLLAQNGGFAAASGPTPQAAAGNFAANYEKCTECAPGGAQYNARVENANIVQGWVTSGNWPTSAGGTSATDTSADADCLVSLPGSSLPIVGSAVPCLLSRTEARALIGGALITAGMSMGLVAVLILAIYGLRETGVARSAAGYLEFAGLGRVASRAASGSGKTGRGPGRSASSPPSAPSSASSPPYRSYQGAHVRSRPSQAAATANRYAASGRQPAYQGKHRAP